MVEKSLKLALKIRAAVYARYSSEMQSSSSAIDQIKRIQCLAGEGRIDSRVHPSAFINIIPDWILKDEALSGKIAGRRGYQTILQGIRERKFDVLLVDDLSRLTRSLGNLLDLYQLLKHYDVELISITDRLSSADPNARQSFTFKGMVADFGNEAHSGRTKRGLEARARELFSTGRQPFGYQSIATKTERRKNRDVPSHFKIEINFGQAEVVRRIFNLYADGFGRSHIAKLLNKEKVPTQQPGHDWNVSTVLHILRNEKYTGRWTYNKTTASIDPDTQKKVSKPLPRSEWIITENEEVRIVQPALWDKVQARLKENEACRSKYGTKTKAGIFGKRRKQEDLHLLSGVLRCGECQGNCVMVSGRHEGYYGCIKAHRLGTCSNKALMPRKKIEEKVLECLEENLVSNAEIVKFATDEYNNLMREHLRTAPNRQREISSEVTKLKTEIQNLVKFIAAGSCSDISAVSDAIKEREARKARLESELGTLEQSDSRKLLVTPFLVQARMAEMVKNLADQSDTYNAVMKGLFGQNLFINRENKNLVMRGSLNLGYVLGSTHCTYARPSFRTSNLSANPSWFA